MRETATYLPSAVKAAAAFEDRGRIDRLARNSDADIRAYDKSHDERKWNGNVLAPIEIYCGLCSVCRVSHTRDLGKPSSPGIPFFLGFSTSAVIPLLPFLVFSHRVCFRENSAF